MKTKLWKITCIAGPSILIGLIAGEYELWPAFLAFGCWIWGLHFRDAFAPAPIKREIRIIQED